MEKNNRIYLGLVIVLTISIGILIYHFVNKDNINEDSIRFYEEYTKYNNKVNEVNNKTYVKVEIDKQNTFEYIDEEKALEVLNGTGVIYFGYSTCPWCRNLVTSLAKVAKEQKETIYYLDILNIRSSFEIKDGTLHKIKSGSDGYYKILNKLEEKLEPYYLTDETGKKYDTNETRLYAPTLIAVSNGKIEDIHVGTLESQLSPYDKLTNNQRAELEKIISKLIASKNSDVCTKDKGC